MMAHCFKVIRGQFGSANSPIGFVTTGGGYWKVWDRFLTIDGKPAFHIGNICGTCAFFFQRVHGAGRSVHPAKMRDTLNAGLISFDEPTARAFGEILPREEYAACLMPIRPRLVHPHQRDDYFGHEQVAIWGGDDAVHDPQTDYYRLDDRAFDRGQRLFQFLIPLAPPQKLNAETLAHYRSAAPATTHTALAISVLDVKEPHTGVEAHWCLAHYLLDGHHKTFAAAETSQPITLLSFLAINQGIADDKNIERLLELLAAES